MSTVYENTVDTLREVGERLAHDVPSSLASVRVPSVRIPSGVSSALSDWPDEVVDRFDRVAHRGRNRRHTSLFAVGGAVAAVLLVAWFVRRRRNADAAEAEHRLSVANGSRAAGAA